MAAVSAETASRGASPPPPGRRGQHDVAFRANNHHLHPFQPKTTASRIGPPVAVRAACVGLPPVFVPNCLWTNGPNHAPMSNPLGIGQPRGQHERARAWQDTRDFREEFGVELRQAHTIGMQCANEAAQGSMLLVPVLQQEWTHDGVKVVNHCLLCGSRYAADGRALTATPLGHLPRSMLVLIHNLISVFLPTFFADVHFPSIACARGPPAPYDMIQNDHCRIHILLRSSRR